MKNKLIFGISGRKRSGKDTAADIMSDILLKNGMTTAKIAFATPLKRICGIMLGMDEGEFIGDECKDKEYVFADGAVMLGRKILQLTGTEAIRGVINDSVWITAMQNSLMLCPAKAVIITDLRFPNEYSFIKSIGGVCIRIERGDLVSTDVHQSETALDSHDFDYTVSCMTGEFDKMKEQIIKIV